MKINQSTRILILLALIVAAVAVWYSLFFASNKPQPVTETAVTIPHPNKKTVTEPVAVTTSARALQVLPIPFLVTEAPEEAPLETTSKPATYTLGNTNVPPNPFVPLRIETTKTASAPKKPAQVPESSKPVLVTPEADLTPHIPVPKTIAPQSGTVTPPPATLGKGTLPIKLNPLTQEVSRSTSLSQALAENNPETPATGPEGTGSENTNEASQEATESGTAATASGTGSSEGGTNDQEAAETSTSATVETPPPPNPLAIWAAQEQLELDGVALGTIGVAIFKTAHGYLTLPVGQTFPDHDVLVKTITAERVLLVDSSGTNTLTLELGGGE